MGKGYNLKGFLNAFFLLSFLSVFLYASYAVSLPRKADFVEGELVIKLKHSRENRVLEGILSRHGLSLEESLPGRGIALVRIPRGFLTDTFKEILSRDPDIEYVEKNYIYRALKTPNDTYYFLQYHHPRIEDPQAWDISTGDPSVVIAVLDTGVESTHPDLSGKVLQGRSFVGYFSSTNTADGNGHGTGVAGTAAAKTDNARGVAGVCWDCLILPVKVLGSNGSGTLFDVIEGMDFVANYAAQNPDKKVIMNLSFGAPCSSSSIEQDAIDNAWSKGVLIVAAAGNDGRSEPICPAARNHVLAVSATDEDDNLASFSNFGSFVDLSAPGVNIVTTWNRSRYVYASGTSFSSPIVAGVAGLIWSLNPNLTNDEVAQLLKDTSDDLGSPGYDIYFGSGRVNSNTALQAAQSGAVPEPTPEPTPTPTPTPPPSEDTVPPEVSITSPRDRSAVFSRVTISASASDNVSVSDVKFYVDGTLLATDSTPPYSAVWDTRGYSRGWHSIEAVATDTSGNTASDEISVFKFR